jgi:hypothetical protein
MEVAGFLQEHGWRRRRRPARVPEAGGAPVVLRLREGAKWMQFDCVVLVVALVYSNDTCTRWIGRPPVTLCFRPYRRLARSGSSSAAGCKQRRTANVRLSVVVLVGMLECSGMVPSKRIDGATGCRSSVSIWAAVVLQRKRWRRIRSRAREAAGGARDLELTLYRPREGAEAALVGDEMAAVAGLQWP